MWAYLIGAVISAAVMGLVWFLVDRRRRRAITVVWGDGLTAEDVENLRSQVDIALQDPNYRIITNYQVHWDTHRVPYSGESGLRFRVPLGRFQRDSTAEQYGGMLVPQEVSDQIINGARRAYLRESSSEIPLTEPQDHRYSLRTDQGQISQELLDSSPGKTRFEILLKGSKKDGQHNSNTSTGL